MAMRIYAKYNRGPLAGGVVPFASLERIGGRWKFDRLNHKGDPIGGERVRNRKHAMETAEAIAACAGMTICPARNLL